MFPRRGIRSSRTGKRSTAADHSMARTPTSYREPCQLADLSGKFPRQSGCRVSAIVVFMGVMIVSQSVFGSCGDYLYRNGRPVSSHFSPMHESPLDASPDRLLTRANSLDLLTRNESPAIPVRRCSGPNCSSSPLPFAPAPNAPSNLIRGFDQAAILESLAGFLATRGAIEFPESERGACFEPSSIFRPPAA